MSSAANSVGVGYIFKLSPTAFVHPFILLPRYVRNGLSNLNETYREYSLASGENRLFMVIRIFVPKLPID